MCGGPYLPKLLGIDGQFTAAHPGDPPPEDVSRSDEPRDVSRLRFIEDLLPCADLLEPSVVDDRYPLSHDEGLFEIVGNEYGGDGKTLMNHDDVGAEFLPHLIVERRKGLVEEEELRLRGEGSREGSPLLLTARYLVRAPVLKAGKPHEGNKLLNPSLYRLSPLFPYAVGDIVVDRHVGKEGIVLKEVAYPP